jgi:hypothetical protein
MITNAAASTILADGRPFAVHTVLPWLRGNIRAAVESAIFLQYVMRTFG